MNEVTVSRDALRKVLKNATIAFRRVKGDITFGFADGHLLIGGPIGATKIAATGSWMGTASVGLVPMKGILSKLPAADPLKVAFRDGRLYFENWSLPAIWQEGSSPPNSPPSAPDHLAALLAEARDLAHYPLGPHLTQQIAEAHADLDARMDQAAALPRPYRVNSGDLLRFMTDHIARLAKTKA